MEHLLPAGVRIPFRIPYICPSENGNLPPPTDEEYAELLTTVISYQTGRGPDNAATVKDQYEIWRAHTRGDRLLHLCYYLQATFFFRTLQFMFEDQLDAAKLTDFCRHGENGSIYLSTTALPQYLEEWRNRMKGLPEDEAAEYKVAMRFHLEQTAVVLKHLGWFLEYTYDNVMPLAKLGPDRQRAVDEPLGMAHFSCVLLHQALVQACGRVLDFEVRAGNALSLRSELPWLKRRMQIEGWCPHTIWKLYNISDIDELVHGYCLGTVRTKQGHSHCSEEVCVANKIVNDGPLRHVHANSDGCITVVAPVDDMVAIMEDGGVPVLRIETDDGYKLSLSARRTSESLKYVAISHVWADGFGSTASNAIAQCQLVRLADRLGKLEATEGCGHLCLWMDTLCIPVDTTHQDHRNRQIERMHEIYKNAYAVMVMDADTLTLRENASLEEVCMRLTMSAWSSRLWTYQEVSLAPRLLLMVADGIIDVDAKIREARDRDDKNDSLSHNLTSKLISGAVFNLGRPHYGNVPMSASGKVVDGEAMLNRIVREGDHDAQTMLHAITHRTTSRPDDEALIIGSSLGVDVGSIIKAPPEKRMTALYNALPHVPANLMFTVGPRLLDPGFRWAPQSVLRSRGCLAANPVKDFVPLTLEQAKGPKRVVRPMCGLDPHGGGLLTFNPAILLRSLYSPARLDEHRLLALELLGRPYAFIGLDAKFDNAAANGAQTKRIKELSAAGTDLAMLLPVFDPTERLYLGAIVQLPSDEPLRAATARAAEATKVDFVMLVQFVRVEDDVVEALTGPGNPCSNVESPGEDWVDGGKQKLSSIGGPRAYEAEWLAPRLWLVD